jgi:hypothetical protein
MLAIAPEQLVSTLSGKGDRDVLGGELAKGVKTE